MESCFFKCISEEFEVNMAKDRTQNSDKGHNDAEHRRSFLARMLRNEKGVALVMALIISLGIMVLVTGVLYFTFQSTRMSGAGKRYSTAEEAADGAVEIIKDAIIKTQRTEPIPSIINEPDPPCFINATLTRFATCDTTITLPGEVNTYTAKASIQNLFRVTIPGSRLEFARAGGAAATAVYYRIIIIVEDQYGNASAENSILYRYTG